MNNQMNPKLTLILHYAFKMLHPVGGIIAICLGYRLFVLGVTGQASISVNSKEISGQLINAAPGLVIAVCGLIVIGISAWRGASISSSPTKLMANIRVTDSGDPRAEGK